MASFLTIGGSLDGSVTRDNLVEPLADDSGDDQRMAPTSATRCSSSPCSACR